MVVISNNSNNRAIPFRTTVAVKSAIWSCYHAATTATPASTSSASKSSSLHARSLSNGATGSFYGNNKLGNTSTGSKSILWDSSNKLNQNLNLPNFSIDNEVLSTPLVVPNAQQQFCQVTIIIKVVTI